MMLQNQIKQELSDDERIYCNLNRLIQLKNHFNKPARFPNNLVNQTVTGRHHSKIRGRGLNFEELRHYQFGDDIRCLDWKTTMRSRKPHVRSFSEEKERHIILVVDQRSSMFFSSLNVMKSVVAAEVAALYAWHAVSNHDLVSFVVLSPYQIHYIKPCRSKKQLIRGLSRLVEINQQLNVDCWDNEDVGIDEWVIFLNKLNYRQSTLLLLSDWEDLQSTHLPRLKSLQRFSEFYPVLVFDPMEKSLPATSPGSFSDGTEQLYIGGKGQKKTANCAMVHSWFERENSLSNLTVGNTFQLLKLDTLGSHIEQCLSGTGDGIQ